MTHPDAIPWFFGFLTLVYVGQIVWATLDAFKPIEVSKKKSRNSRRQVNLLDCMKVFDGGFRDAWVFFILAVMLPVFLTALVNLAPLFSGERANEITQIQATSTPSAATSEWSGKLIYFMCVAFVCVLITLEFSYLHTLRQSASSGWIGMLLAALAIDVVDLLILIIMVQNPESWQVSLSTPTKWAICIATFAAVVSSFWILVLARTSGALNDGKVDDFVIDGKDTKITVTRSQI